MNRRILTTMQTRISINHKKMNAHCRMIHASKMTWVEGNRILTKLGSLNHENEAIDFDW